MSNTESAYHSQCTGDALQTVQRHSADEDIVLFAACFCPFAQRAWVTLEHLGIPYKVIEVDPFEKPKALLELSPKGLVPALRLNNYDPPRALNESTVIVEFIEDLASTTTKRTLLPPPSEPYARALVRLQSDHINRTFVPAFYRYLHAQELDAQLAAANEFKATIDTLVELFERAEREVGGTGLWREEGELGWADVMAGPWMFRAGNVLKRFRGFEMPQEAKFTAWLNRLYEHPSWKRTISNTEELYLDSYGKFALGKSNNSQVAKALNSGKGLP